jgi:E3 ubiquitin-protein ligase DRIP
MQQKRAAPSAGLNIPAQTIVDANSKCDTRFSPIWFSLVASDHEQ